MKTWLCTTLTSILGPTLGPARLFAYAKKQGFDISLKDYNQEAYFALLSRRYLEQACDRLANAAETMKRNKFLRGNVGAVLLNSSCQGMKPLVAAGLAANSESRSLTGISRIAKKPVMNLIGSKIKNENMVYALLSQKEYVISEIEKSRLKLYEEFFKLHPDDYFQHFSTLLCGKAIVDAAYFPTLLDFGLGMHGTAFAPVVGDVMRAVNDERFNFLIPYFREKMLPDFKSEAPALVGISVTHASEFVPAFTLARMIKSENPEVHICLGGATLTEVSHRVARNLPLWDYIDSLVKGPGERVFCQLIDTVEKGNRLSGVPNLIYRQNGKIVESEKHLEFDLDQTCTPEFPSIRPRSILPLETSSGCYWGKCIFCYYPKEGTANFNTSFQKTRIRKTELVLQDIASISKGYNPIFIGFTDSSLSPIRIEQIAEYNLKTSNPVNFSSFFRFEKEFKSLSFCENLARGGFLGGQVGLESGSQRINNLINKGVDLKDSIVILQNFTRCGIMPHLYTIVGLPTETREEARMTYNFIKRWHKHLTLGWQVYSLGILEHGPMTERATEFGMSLKPLAEDYLIQAMQYQVSDGLSQAASAALAIGFTENLKGLMHPLSNFMDVESHKIVLMARRSYYIDHSKMRNSSTTNRTDA